MQGRPIYIQHLGAINIKKLTEITSEERMLKFHIQEYERCTKYIMQACSRTSGHHVDQTFAIIDVTGNTSFISLVLIINNNKPWKFLQTCYYLRSTTEKYQKLPKTKNGQQRPPQAQPVQDKTFLNGGCFDNVQCAWVMPWIHLTVIFCQLAMPQAEKMIILHSNLYSTASRL